MDFQMLGPLQVVERATSIPLGGPRQRHVLAALLARRGRLVNSEVLIDEVWGSSPPASAVTSLQIAVSKLRRALGAGRIETRPTGYGLVVHEHDVDAGRFEQWVEDGNALLAAGDPGGGGRLLQKGIALWRGNVLADIDGGDLITVERSRLEELKLAAVEASVEARLAHGQHTDLVAELTALVAAHPFRERLHGHLMLALYRAGRQADALAAYQGLRSALADELGIDPSSELTELEGRILRQDPTLLVPSPRILTIHLPMATTDLVGRETELQDLRKILDNGSRLICLTGAGGVGKTRLMLALAQRLAADSFEADEEMIFVDFSPLNNSELVLPTISNALGIKERGDRTLVDAVVDTVGSRRLTLLLDNCEKVIDAAPSFSKILVHCPQLRLIATSRERLALRDEREFAVGPLPLPDASITDISEIGVNPAVQLFCERARAVQRDFELTERNAGAVAELCRRLDGLPLALELAAARTKLLAPVALVARLTRDRRGVLSGGARDLPERHRTLDTTIAWSYDALTASEQRILQVCAVFAGAASIDALETVCQTLGDDEILDQISSLLNKSLLVRQSDDTDVPRVTMLETVRGFALDRLAELGELVSTSRRHAAYYDEFGARAGAGLWDEYDLWMTSLEFEMDNVRAALEWSFSCDGGEIAIRILANLGRFWIYRGALAEGSRWLTEAVGYGDGASRDGASVRLLLAEIEVRQGRFDGWAQSLPAIASVLDGAGDQIGFASALMCLSDMRWESGHPEDAITVAEQALGIASTTGLPLLLSNALSLLGVSKAENGQPEVGLELLKQAAALVPPGTASWFRFVADANLSWALIQDRQYEQARDQLAASLATGVIGDRDLYGQVVRRINLGWTLLATSAPREALTHFIQAGKFAHRLGDPWQLAEVLAGIGCAAADLGKSALAGRSFGMGVNMAADKGVALSPYVADQQRERMVGIPATEPCAAGQSSISAMISEAEAVLSALDR